MVFLPCSVSFVSPIFMECTVLLGTFLYFSKDFKFDTIVFNGIRQANSHCNLAFLMWNIVQKPVMIIHSYTVEIDMTELNCRRPKISCAVEQ